MGMCGQGGSHGSGTHGLVYCQVLMKSPNKILVKILHSVPVLSSLTVSQLQRLADVLTEVTVAQRSVTGGSRRVGAAIQRNPTKWKCAVKARRSL